jgi:hypothetical protein
MSKRKSSSDTSVSLSSCCTHVLESAVDPKWGGLLKALKEHPRKQEDARKHCEEKIRAYVEARAAEIELLRPCMPVVVIQRFSKYSLTFGRPRYLNTTRGTATPSTAPAANAPYSIVAALSASEVTVCAPSRL